MHCSHKQSSFGIYGDDSCKTPTELLIPVLFFGLDQVFALMYLQNDVNEVKASTDKIVKSNFRQIQCIENFMATAGTGQLPTTVSRGHVILIDATGREHPMLLDQCQYLDVWSYFLNVYEHETLYVILATGSHASCEPLSVQAGRSRDPKVVH